jgi:hypothetical protein
VNKHQFTQLFARLTRRRPAEAADEIDNLVYRMLKELKRPFARNPRERSTAAGSTNPNKQDR